MWRGRLLWCAGGVGWVDAADGRALGMQSALRSAGLGLRVLGIKTRWPVATGGAVCVGMEEGKRREAVTHVPCLCCVRGRRGGAGAEAAHP